MTVLKESEPAVINSLITHYVYHLYFTYPSLNTTLLGLAYQNATSGCQCLKLPVKKRTSMTCMIEMLECWITILNQEKDTMLVKIRKTVIALNKRTELEGKVAAKEGRQKGYEKRISPPKKRTIGR